MWKGRRLGRHGHEPRHTAIAAKTHGATYIESWRSLRGVEEGAH